MRERGADLRRGAVRPRAEDAALPGLSEADAPALVSPGAASPLNLQCLTAALISRYDSAKGWVILEEVSNDRASRLADMLALQAWGRPYVEGLEIKLSRADWLREVAEPEKREFIEETCRFRWFVAPAGMIERAEVPEGWGLLEAVGSGPKLRRALAAPAREVPPLPKWLVRQIWHLADGRRQAKDDRKRLLDQADVQQALQREAAQKERQAAERADLDEARRSLKQERAQLEATWRELCALAGFHTSFSQQAERRGACELFQGLQREAARRVVELARLAEQSCRELVELAEEGRT